MSIARAMNGVDGDDGGGFIETALPRHPTAVSSKPPYRNVPPRKW